MKSSNENSWKYLTEERLGENKFDGIPCPSKEVVQKIGIDGVNEIDAIIKEMIKCKEKIYGVDSKLLGFFPYMAFMNMRTKHIVACKEILWPFPNDPAKAKKFFEFPEKAVSGNYWISF